jgi:RimJ/RimL family protein N-acetyltransferase
MSIPGEVILREVRDSDLPILYEQQADPVAWKLADWPPREFDAFMEHWAHKRLDPLVWARIIEVDGQVVGSVQCFLRDGVREVGYWLGKEYWGRGYASSALAQFLPLVPIRPLFAQLAGSNVGSRRVLEKSGFVVINDRDGDLWMRLA